MDSQNEYIEHNGKQYILANEEVDETGVRVITFKCVDDLLKWFGSNNKE